MIGKRVKLINKTYQGVKGGHYIVKVTSIDSEHICGPYECHENGKMTANVSSIGSFRWDEIISLRVLTK